MAETWKKEVGKSFLVLANVIAGALVFGQFVSNQINWLGFLIGVFATVALYISSIILLKK